jgi:hypothetical protein
MLDVAILAWGIQQDSGVRVRPFETGYETARAGRVPEIIISGGMVGGKRGYDEYKEYEE